MRSNFFEWYDSLTPRDFENGAVRDEIRKTVRRLQLQANQLHDFCPDHRDKQKGKPCLACEVERLEGKLRRLSPSPTTGGA